MKKFLLAALTVLVLTVSAFADFHVAKKNHMQNMDPGRCAWCALETLGRTLGWKSLEGCRDRNERGAYREDMIAELDKCKVRYRVHWPKEGEHFYHVIHIPQGKTKQTWIGVRRSEAAAKKLMRSSDSEGVYWIERRLHWSTEFIRDALDDGLGVAVSLDIQTGKHSRHMVVVVGMDDDTVRIVDSNWKAGTIREESMAWFVTHFNGFALVIERPRK